ncbi:hypothetical protein [Acetobacterium wieringae]|uniref:hypothetical protein n=1 Tax=Acetobacterium wieringae TaxID=52694 RepID=UPI0031588E0D
MDTKHEKSVSVDEMYMVIKNLLIGNDLVYVSTPINTGERYIDWFLSLDKKVKKDHHEFFRQRNVCVIEPNINNARKCIQRIRKNTSKLVIDPSTIENDNLNWSQDDFYLFWDKVIKNLVDEIIMLDGWEYSVGCCYELLSAIENNIEIYSQNMKRMTVADASLKLRKSLKRYSSHNMPEEEKIKAILEKVEKLNQNEVVHLLKFEKERMKDEKLDVLISNNIANIAQYISFEPYSSNHANFVHINGFCKSKPIPTKELIIQLIEEAPSKSVNIRSFSTNEIKGSSLVYDKKLVDIDEILNVIEENANMGKYSIINERIDIFDGGVSGVVFGDIIEFSPEDTPKCVDKEGVCSLPRDLGVNILNTVYGFSPELKFDPHLRIEFSIHPSRQGANKKHTIIWEYEYYERIESECKIIWPNRFSKFMGDKVFGLLIAENLGLLVPKTTVVSRNIAPFSFGKETGLFEKWTRTSPIIKESGKYYSGINWVDPFRLMNSEEKKGDKNETNIASILCQDAIEAEYSGAAFVRSKYEKDLIEGVKGVGENFMLGKQKKEKLPTHIIEAVKNLNNQIRVYHKELGDVSIEWVYDGSNVWVVQLNQLKNEFLNNSSGSRVIVSGTPDHYDKFFVEEGLDKLRNIIPSYVNKNVGIDLIGNVGITSHFGDLLRQNNIPSKLSEITK